MSENQVVGASAPVAIRDAEAFIFDMDGVLYRGKQALPGVNELIAALEARSLPYLLATNNSSATPADYVRRMAGYGVTVDESHIQTSATATRDFLVRELAKLPGVEVAPPAGAMYAFFRVDGLTDSFAFCKRLVHEARIGLAPGSAFGPEGEGCVRWCFASDEARLAEGVSRLARVMGAP